jgi:hypothetical protein
MKFLILFAMLALAFLGLETHHLGGSLCLLILAYMFALFAF